MIECILNNIDNEWWFGIGISYNQTELHPKKKHVITFELIFFSIYLRW